MLKAGFVLDGKYRILSVIGQGGMSTVYLAVHERLKQKWAVKEISMEYCENYEMISRKLIVEADILKRLDHPGLPKIVDIIEKKDAIWMVMEFIEGKTLKEILLFLYKFSFFIQICLLFSVNKRINELRCFWECSQ
mgnify:CR=1 FL=1